jgi:hypothetical protein
MARNLDIFAVAGRSGSEGLVPGGSGGNVGAMRSTTCPVKAGFCAAARSQATHTHHHVSSTGNQPMKPAATVPAGAAEAGC